MIFYGFQKLTLLDFPGKTACTVFTAGCNFRCPFCHNASLVVGHEHKESYTDEDILSYLKKRKGILDGVCITGGEPLINKRLDVFMRSVKDEGFLVKLDTNGSFPDRLLKVIEDGLVDYVAMDIKASEKNYARATGLKEVDFNAIKKSIYILKNSGTAHEFRTTAIKGIHTPEEIVKIIDIIGTDSDYYIQNFVDSGDLIEKETYGLTPPEMHELLNTAQGLTMRANLRGI